jgi:putative ABC transport system ATP-binding protein
LLVSGAELSLADVTFGFGDGQETLGPIDLHVPAGGRVALVGPSGSGKSTLLQLIAGVLTPRRGLVSLDGDGFSRLGVDARARVRLQRMGLVFQFAELLPELTLRENVEFPSRLLGRRADEHVEEVLRRLGIDHVADHVPSRVSGGERQRAAIARAVAHHPAVILADEPTGALDEANGSQVLDLLLEVADTEGATLIVVTHDAEVAKRLPTLITLRDGLIEQ